MTMTDAQQFYKALQGSLSSDANARMQSELELKKMDQCQGYAPLALQVAVSEPDQAIRMCSAVCFKNKVKSGWFKSISQQDKQVIKHQIVSALVQASVQTQPQFKLALHYMLNHDFPHDWPEYLDQVSHFVQQSNDLHAVHGGLLALQEVVMVFQWKPKSQRSPLTQIVQNVFPHLLQIANHLLTLDSDQAAQIMKIITKTYHASIHASLCKPHMANETLSGWCTLLTNLIMKPNTSEFWTKAKKWAFKSLNHLHARYGNSKQDRFVNEKQYKLFSKTFMTSYAPTILQTYMQFTSQAQSPVLPRIQYLLIQFYADCIGHKAMWALICPYTLNLVQTLVQPALTLSQDQLDQWTDDPSEYVHAKTDPLDDYKSPSSAALALLNNLVDVRYKYTFELILQHVQAVVQAHAVQPSMQSALAKDAVLRMLGELAHHCLGKQSPVKPMMEQFLVTSTFSEFQSPYKFLRARALATLAAFASIQFSNTTLPMQAFQAVVQGLNDQEELPIRVEAAIALKPMMGIDVVRNAMTPHVADLMRALLSLHTVIDMDVVTESMEAIVEEFAAEVVPFAVDLAHQLSNTFIRIMSEAQEGLDSQYDVGDSDSDDNDCSYFDTATEKTMNAMALLKTVQTLILSVQDADALVMQLEQAILPSLVYVLDHQIIDLYPDVFEIVDTCTFATKSVSQTMWSLFAKLHLVCKTDAADYICEMVPALDNYISYGKDVFKTNQQVQLAMLDMIDTCIVTADLGESDRVCGCQLIESMLLNLQGHIDHLVPHFLSRTMPIIAQNKFKTAHYKVSAIEVGLNAIYYNPILTLKVMEDNQWTVPFFTVWMQTVPKMSRVHDKKLGICALCALIRVPQQHLPLSVQQGMPQLMRAMVAYLSTMDLAVANRDQEEKFFSGSSSEDRDSSVSVQHDDDDAVDLDCSDGEWEDDEDELEVLSREARLAREGGLDGSDADELDDELIEEITLETPLDNMDPFITFATVFTDIQHSNAPVYQLLTTDLSAEHQHAVHAAMQRAAENQAKVAAA